MRNSKMIFIFLVAMSLAVSASMFVVSSALAEEGAKKAKHGGIIGALEGVLKDMEKEDGGKKVEDHSGRERKKVEGEEEHSIAEPEVFINIDDYTYVYELEAEKDFIIEEGEREESASTTDEEGNTTTVYKTKNGVWVKKVTDKNGNVILEERKTDIPGGGKKVETIDHKAGTKTQTTYDAVGRITSSYTENINGSKTRAKYRGGVIMLSKTTDSLGNVTNTTYDNKGRVERSYTKDKDGRITEAAHGEDAGGTYTVTHVNHEKGVTTATATAPDGSKIEETRDNKTGETLSEVGISADGKLFTYQTGSDADKAFEAAGRISTTKYSSTKDWAGGKESGASEFRYKNQAELDRQDRQLEEQMRGGKAVAGDDIIVSSLFKERTSASRREGQEGERTTGIERIATSSEVRAVKPDGPYGVKPAGEPVSAEGYGKTPSEALSNALNGAASTVVTRIRGETLDQMRHTQTTSGGVETGEVGEDITSTLDASSFVVFDGYEVENVRIDEGHFVVKVRATPGVTVRR